MNRNGSLVLAAVLLSVALFSTPAIAGAEVHVTIAPPPPFALHAPPPLMLIPGTYVYFAPDIDGDIIYFQGYWYRPYRSGWYRSNSYNGRWVLVPKGRVPRAVISLPPDWRRISPGQQRIPYGQVQRNWHQWERDRHWDRHAPPPKQQAKPKPGQQMKQQPRQQSAPPPAHGRKQSGKPHPEERREQRPDQGPGRAPDDGPRDEGPRGGRR